MIFVAVTREKRRLLDEYLEWWGRDVAPRVRIEEWERVATAPSVRRGVWLLSDLDGLGPAGLRFAEILHDTLTDAGLVVHQHPRRTLRRLELLQELHRRGINDFTAVRASEAGGDLRYPVFLRRASDHLGPIADLLANRAEVDAALEHARKLGIPLDDLILVEFQDTSHAEGRYRKYGTFIVGDRVLPRHVLEGRNWMLKHNRSELTLETQRRELDHVLENPHAQVLGEIAAVAGVSYGRIDYSVGRDGRPQVWEINLCPTIGRGARPPSGRIPEEARPHRRRVKEHFYRLFAEAWSALDRETDSGPPVELPAPESLRKEMLRELEEPVGGAGLLAALRAKSLWPRRW